MYHRPKTDSKGNLVSVEFGAGDFKSAFDLTPFDIIENVLIEYHLCSIDAGIKGFVVAFIVIVVVLVVSFKVVEQG